MNDNHYIERLNWRYATKKYDDSKKVDAKVLADIVEATRLAPSSFGLMPFRVIHVVDKDVRVKLQEKAFGQDPFVSASELYVFVVPTNLDQRWVDTYFQEVMRVRGLTEEMVQQYKQMVSGFVAGKNQSELTAWAAKQAYISLGFMLSAAAEYSVDSTPMEGFDAAGFDEVLGLAEMNMTSVVSCAIGYRSADDSSAAYKKVRFPMSEFVKEV